MTTETKTPQVDLLGAALFQASEGIPVFPCSPRTKAPLTQHGFQDATVDREQIKTWWAKWPDALIGSPTGRITDRLILDTDSDRAEDELRLLAEQSGAEWPPETFTVASNRGKHFYFLYPGKIELGNSSRTLPDNVDIRGNGGYVIVPPSPHPAGGFYTVLNHTPKIEIPMWLFKILVDWDSTGKAIEIKEATPGWALRQYHRAIADLKRAKEGTRNATLNTAAFWASRLSGHPLLSEKETSKEIRQIAERLGLNDREIEATCQSGWRGGQTKKIKILSVEETTDVGNAERYVLRHGNVVRYVPKYGPEGWHIWDLHRWKPDGKRQVDKWAQETVRGIQKQAAEIEDDAIRKRLTQWAIKSEDARRIRAMMELVKPLLALEPAELDADLELLNLQNGTLDLQTGVVREQHASDLITRMLPVSFEPSAMCPLFTAHIKLVLPDDTVRDYFQEMAAYCFTGSTGEQAIHVLYGEGENGKSTTIDILRNLSGDYGWPAPRALFAGGYHDIAPHQIADLNGRRFVTCSEFKKDDVLRVEVMKALTAGQASEITGARKYGHAFQFRPQAKYVLDSNYLLGVDSPDFGTWRRIRVIPFDQTISGKVKKDLHFDKKLWAERSGIFNWILEGLRRWNARGRVLQVPKGIVDASKAYEVEQDLLEQFIFEECSREGKTELTRFTAKYQTWLKERTSAKGAKLGKRAVKAELTKKGFAVNQDDTQRYDVVRGLSFRDLYGGGPF